MENLSAKELNSIFKVLPTVDYYKDYTEIDFSDNPALLTVTVLF